MDVLIPVYKPGPELSELLRRLAKQVYPIHKVLIVNTEERYWDIAYEREYPGCEVTHIRKEEFDHGGTRHWMAEQSSAEIMDFMTQDALPAVEEVDGNLVKVLGDGKVKVAYAR